MMKLIPRSSQGTSLINRMQNEMEDVFQRFFGPLAEAEFAPVTRWSPSVDVEETDKNILVKADLPGVDPKDIEITLQNGELTLRGEKKEQREEKGKNFCRCERFSGSFLRTIPLPADADESNVTATTSKGVITVTIPKKPGTQSKKITVQNKD